MSKKIGYIIVTIFVIASLLLIGCAEYMTYTKYKEGKVSLFVAWLPVYLYVYTVVVAFTSFFLTKKATQRLEKK